MSKDDGGPAFSLMHPTQPEFSNSGMSLRDWFAGQVIVGLHCSPDVLRALNKAATKNAMKFQDIAAAHAYSIADAMLEARKR